MAPDAELQQVRNRRDLNAFVRFPWQIYRGDPNWVPPLIAERTSQLAPAVNSDAGGTALFLARRGGRTAGTIAAIADTRNTQPAGDAAGTFGFFEVIDDYDVAGRLLDAARAWLKARGALVMRGPLGLSNHDNPGVLIEGADCPPVVLAAHTPPYYKTLLERYGMQKYHDLYAWRAFRSQIGEELEHIPDQIRRVAQVARQRGVTVRPVRLDRWPEEVASACYLFNATLSHLPEYVPTPEAEFRQLADAMRPVLDPDLALFAELAGRIVGFCISLPDLNRALIHLNGRLFPYGWLQLWWYARRIDVLTFKLMGVLPEMRARGIDALLFMESLRAMMAKGYQWLDGSLTSENNAMINLLASRFGAQRYKHYRIYEMPV